jgi:hypothetical protein
MNSKPNIQPYSEVAINGLAPWEIPIRVEHKGTLYDLSLVSHRTDFGSLVVMIRLTPVDASLDAGAALTWGHQSFADAWRAGDFVLRVEGENPDKPAPYSEVGKRVRELLERIEHTNNLLFATTSRKCTRVSLEPGAALFVGVMPAALVFAHRDIEKDGDYLRLGFLAYDTLEWKPEWPCAGELGDPLDPAIREAIEQEVASMRAKAGQDFRISSTGQMVRLGGKSIAENALKSLAHEMAKVNPGLTFAYDASGVYSLHGDKIIMAMSKAITGQIVDMCDSPRDVTEYVKREGLTVLPVVAGKINDAPLPVGPATGKSKAI